MRLRTLTMTYRSMQRMREVLGVFSRHGFRQVLLASGLWRFVPMAQRIRRRGGGLGGEVTAPQRLRLVLEELGPTFIKLGQMLASRPDLVPAAYTEEFRKLQDHVHPFDFEAVQNIVETVTGAPLEASFAEVEREPLAAASMAQVHRARLLDGTPVVLKVRRPGIVRTIGQDLSVLELLVAALERYVPETRDVGLPVILEEFARTIRAELDFHREASHTERIRRNFAGSHEIVVPRVYWKLTSDQLLVMERIEDGIPLNPSALEAAGLDPGVIGKVVARAFLKQVLEDGVFHADLHPGNLLATPDGRVALLDFGAVGFLSEDMQDSLGTVFLALYSHDYAAICAEYMKIGTFDYAVDERRFERDIRDLVEPYHGRPLSELRIGEILRESVSIAIRHRIQVPAELVLLGRTAFSVEGLVRRLDPNLVVLDEAIPFAKRLLIRRFDPRRHARTLHHAARDYKDFAVRFPSQVSRILQRMIDSRLSFDFVHKGYEKALDEVDRSSNRIAVSLIISALIVGSALIVLAGKGPMVWDFPVLGIVGFVIAGVMGFVLAIQILRSGKY